MNLPQYDEKYTMILNFLERKPSENRIAIQSKNIRNKKKQTHSDFKLQEMI